MCDAKGQQEQNNCSSKHKGRRKMQKRVRQEFERGNAAINEHAMCIYCIFLCACCAATVAFKLIFVHSVQTYAMMVSVKC